MSRRSLRETTEPRGPFSRPLDVHTVPEAGLDLAIEASPEERAAVAAEIGLVALGALSARFHIERRAGGRLAVDGLAEAGITQTCVVSLEPFESIVERELELAFAPQANSVEARSRERGRGDASSLAASPSRSDLWSCRAATIRRTHPTRSSMDGSILARWP